VKRIGFKSMVRLIKGKSMVDNRLTPEPGRGDNRWIELSKTLKDCRALMVSGIGQNPKENFDQQRHSRS
jgi:hypothetical protein